MGKRRIEIKKIECRKALQVCFSKRRQGVFKKAKQLSSLCGVDVLAIAFSPAGKPFAFASSSSSSSSSSNCTPESLIKRYFQSTSSLKPSSSVGAVRESLNQQQLQEEDTVSVSLSRYLEDLRLQRQLVENRLQEIATRRASKLKTLNSFSSSILQEKDGAVSIARDSGVPEKIEEPANTIANPYLTPMVSTSESGIGAGVESSSSWLSSFEKYMDDELEISNSFSWSIEQEMDCGFPLMHDWSVPKVEEPHCRSIVGSDRISNPNTCLTPVVSTSESGVAAEDVDGSSWLPSFEKCVDDELDIGNSFSWSIEEEMNWGFPFALDSSQAAGTMTNHCNSACDWSGIF